MVYRSFGGDSIDVHNKYIKWVHALGTDFCEGLLDFAKLHKEIYVVTNVAKYRSFQY